MANLLLVDDDVEVLEINKKLFEQDGYTVKTAESADAALKILSKFVPDCILLDVMMPGLNGFDAFGSIKKASNNAAIIYLTGRISEDDKVDGLLLGADDYIEKPYSLKELKARVTVQLRKKTPVKKNSNEINVPPLRINSIDHKVFYGTTEISLSNREYELLHLLAVNANNLVTFEQIGQSFFTVYTDADRRTIMVTASRLRKKIEDYTGLDNIIETAYSKGYTFRTKG